MRRIPRGNDFEGWVGQLGIASGRQQAKRHLMQTGSAALPALRRGLRHRDPIVRRICAGILDHLVDDASVPDLVAALDDEDPRVCARALHALACDQCKQNECRPADDLFVPRALELLRDGNPDVRAAAIDALGKVAERRPDIAAALGVLGEQERHPGLRTMARRRTARARSRADSLSR
jgi:HEAT repeat protein